MQMKDVKIGKLTVGNDRPLMVIAGPCQLESLDHAQMIAGTMAEACAKAGAQYVFKASYDKANRTSLKGRRGLGIDAGLKVLEAVRQLRGEAGARQVAGAKIGLTHVLGFGNGSAAGVHIFEKA